MPTSDGKIVIQIDDNARQATNDFQKFDSAVVQSTKDVRLAKVQLDAHNSEMKYLGKTTDSMKQKQAQLTETYRRAKMELANNKVALEQYRQAQQNSVGSSNNLMASLGNLKGALIAAAAAFAAMKLAEFGRDILKVSSQFEQLNVAFEVLAGQQAGQQLVKDLTDLANVTPMTTQGLANNARLLLAFGEASQNVTSDLKLLGDISGGNQEKMDSLTLVFAQAGSAGRLMGQDLLQMVNAGFNPLQIISEKTGKSMSELRKEMEQGKISFAMIKQAMIDATSEGGRFYGMMEKQSQTLEGRLSTLSDKLQLISKDIGDLLLPTAKMAVDLFIKWTDATQELTSRFILARKSIQELGLADLQQKLRMNWVEQDKLTASWQNWNKVLGNNVAHKMAGEALIDAEKQEQAIMSQINLLVKQQKEAAKTADTTAQGFRNSSTEASSHSEKIKKVKDEYQKLQEQSNKLKETLLVMSIQNKNSGDIWNATAKKYQDTLNQLSAAEKTITDLTKVPNEVLNSYEELGKKISNLKTQLQDMALSGQAGTPTFDIMKNNYVEALNQMEQANRQVSNAMGIDWDNLGNSIRQDLASAITTPLQEGETAFERLGNVALNIISMVGQKIVEQLLEEISLTQLLNSVKTIGKVLSFGLFANGDVFSGGKPQAFANGGVVSSPTLFPMANGTGLMAEKGAEAIMPLKRSSNGRLGVEATGTQNVVNVYNQTQSQIETVTRPSGETDIFIRKVNNALSNERTQAGFAQASSRQNQRGITAA